MLALSGVDAYYGESHVLQGVSFEVSAGEIVALLGRNGVGKTTTMRTIIGLTRQTGSIQLHNQEITTLKPWQRAQHGIGYIPEDRRIIVGLTVEENLRVAMWGARRSGRWTLEQVYRHFPVLNERRKQLGTTLSGGEQQMLTVARALLGNPEILLLDEPSQGLSPRMVKVVRDIIESIHRGGITILLVEQNLQLALGLAQRAYILNKGRVVHHATTQELQKQPELTRQYLSV